MESCAAGRSPALTHAAATGSRSPPTSAAGRASTARSSNSRRRTPNRTTATTRPWRQRSTRARSWPNLDSDPVSTSATLPPVQFLLYEFGPDSRFEGQLGGALERFEGRGPLRILEVMFMQRDAETGELVVLDLRGEGLGSLIAPILDFRLDAAARR